QGGTGEHREAEDHDVPVGRRATERACPVPDGMIVDVPLVAHLTGSARLASAAAAGPSGVFVEVGLATGGLIVVVRVVEEDGLSAEDEEVAAVRPGEDIRVEHQRRRPM